MFLFHHQAKLVVMIYHMDVIKAAISILDPGQVPIITDDQLLYCVNIYTWKTDSVKVANNCNLYRAGLKLGWVNLHMSGLNGHFSLLQVT